MAGVPPFTPPLLHPHDLYLLRYYAAVMRVMRPVLQRVFLLLRPANGGTIKQLLFALPGYSRKQYKEFTEPERLKLDNDVPSEEFDVSLLHRLLQRVCGLSASNSCVAGTLENRLKLLKGHRNALAHEDLWLTAEELRLRVSQVEDLCREVLVIAGLRSRKLVTRYVREMEEGFDEILVGSINIWEPYRQGLEHLRQEQCNILVREGKLELSFLSQRLQILNPFAWVLETDFSHLTIEEVFTELELEGSGVVEMQNLLRVTTPFGSLPDALIISGSPGIGKTSLTRFLLHDWLSDDPTVQGLDDFDLLLPIEVRNVSSADVCGLVRDELLPSSCRHLHREDVLPTLREVSVLWVVDGYDEASGDTRKLIKELLHKFQSSKFLITLRTECRREVELLMRDLHISHLTIVNKGFSDTNIRVCTEKLFKVSVNNNERKATCAKEQFLDFIGERPACQEMLRVPLLLTMLVVLWLEEDSSVISGATTTTRLHHVLINHVLTKMFARYSSSRLGLSETNFRKKMDVFLAVLGRYFWVNNFKYTYRASDIEIEELENICNSLDLPFKDAMSPFFTFDSLQTRSGDLQETYTVIHRTVKEFLSGRAFCVAMISQDRDVLTTGYLWMGDSCLLHQHHHGGEPESVDAFTMQKMSENECSEYDEEVFPHNDRFETNLRGKSLVNIPSALEGERERSRCYRYFSRYTPFSSSFTIFFIAGYLKLRRRLTLARAEQLVYVLSLGDYSIDEYSSWLSLIHESEEDAGVIREVSDFLTTFQWAPEPQDDLVVQKLLKYVVPELVFILQKKVLDDCSGVRRLSRTFSRVPAEIHIDFRNQFSEPGPDVAGASECLRVLLGRTSKCRLTTLSCFMSVECSGLLKRACHLQELCIKLLNTKDLHRLSKSLPSLQSLKNLTIVFDPQLLATRPGDLPTLELPSDKKLDKSRRMERWFRILPRRPEAFHQLFHLGTLCDVYVKRWNLPPVRCPGGCSPNQNSLLTAKNCHRTPPMLCQRHSRVTHIFSMRYHRESLQYLRGVRRLVQTSLATVRQYKEKFNFLSRCSDPLGTWRIWLLLCFCEALILEHKTSIALHRRVLTYQGMTTRVPPSCITLVLPDALAVDPRQVGAVVGRLCRNPSLVKLEGRFSSTDAGRLASYLFWIGSSVSRVQCIRLAIETTRNRRKELSNLEYKLLATMARTGPSFKYHFNWWF